MLTKLALETWIASRVERTEGHPPVGLRVMRHVAQAGELFRNPIVRSEARPEGYHLYFARPLVCFNSLYLNEALAQIPSGATAVYLHVTDLVTLIDHTTSSILLEFVDEFKRSGRGIVEILGLERLRPRSHDQSCMRVSPPIPALERAEALQTLSRLSLTSEIGKSMDLDHCLAHLSLTPIDRPAPFDNPIPEFLTWVTGAFLGRSRAGIALLRASFAGTGGTTLENGRDHVWIGPFHPPIDREEPTPESSLAYLSLTGPARRAGAAARPSRPDISMVWERRPSDYSVD
jgi:hypothetical protein